MKFDHNLSFDKLTTQQKVYNCPILSTYIVLLLCSSVFKLNVVSSNKVSQVSINELRTVKVDLNLTEHFIFILHDHVSSKFLN